MQVCKRCLLDSQIDGITFDQDGVCCYCHQFDATAKVQVFESADAKQSALDSLVKMVKSEGKGKQYDCLIGISGGVDSSYVAYITKELGLRPLAVHLDNGWNSELAVGNIEKVCKALDIDLFTYVIDWEEFRDLQLSFLKASVANAEAPTDHAIFACLYKTARKFKIKYILDGVNTSTEFTRRNFFAAGYTYADLSQIRGIHKRFGTKPLKTFPRMGMLKKMFTQKIKGVKQLHILNLIDFNKTEAMKLLQTKFGWHPYDGKHHESVYTKWHQLVYLPRKFGFDKRKLHLSDLILSKQISREEALRELERKQVSDMEIQQLEAYVQKKLGLTEEEYNAIVSAPPKPFTEYPNSKWIINLYDKWNTYKAKKVAVQ